MKDSPSKVTISYLRVEGRSVQTALLTEPSSLIARGRSQGCVLGQCNKSQQTLALMRAYAPACVHQRPHHTHLLTPKHLLTKYHPTLDECPANYSPLHNPIILHQVQP